MIGGIVFVFNLTLLCFIGKLAVSGAKNDKFGLIIHILFITVNDTLCGLFLFLIGWTPVQDKASAYACAVFVFMGLALQTVSQGNIACICIQRYVISKHIRAIQAKWRSVHTKTLLLVNLCLGVLSFGVCIAAFDINRIPTLNALCKLSNIMDDKTAKIVTINIVLGTMITFVADVFCFLTFHQLKTQVCVAGSTETNTATSSNRSTTNTDSSARTSIRTRQSKALWTIFIIVTFFNLSTFPPIVGYTLISLHDNIFSIYGRSLLLTLYLNSLINPIVIATHTHEVYMSIKDTVLNVVHRIQSCFTCIRITR